jgi:peptidoglycan/LPS O-acetylase OafA/YrhL
MPTRINNVQALRGFAALFVVFGHTLYTFPHMVPFGTFGVDVFFVNSGFIMAMICDLNPEKFFLRRLIRIVPLYWVATLGVFFLAMVAPSLMKTTKPVPWELALSLLFVPFYKESGTTNPILFVGWTLNYEMFFYVVLATCLAINRKRATLLAATAIFATVLICRPFGHRLAITSMYGDLVMLEFVLGMAAYHLVRRTSDARAREFRWLAALGVIAGATLLIVMEGTNLGPTLEWNRLFEWGIPAFVLVGSAALLSKGGADTRVRLLVLLGDASYVIYILHTYVLDGFERVLARRWPWLELSRATGCVLSMVLVSALSVAIYLWAERPTVDWLSEKLGTRRIRRAEVKDPAESMA